MLRFSPPPALTIPPPPIRAFIAGGGNFMLPSVSRFLKGLQTSAGAYSPADMVGHCKLP